MHTHTDTHTGYSSTHLREGRGGGGLSLPRVQQNGVDEVREPTSTQALPPRRSPSACWELYDVEHKVQLTWMSETGAEGEREGKGRERKAK